MRHLQINTSGAWRNVMRYPRERDQEVRTHAALLAEIVGAKLRVIDAAHCVLWYWDRDRGWEKPWFAEDKA